MKIIKETSYEDEIAIAENYAKYELEIAELEKQNYEQLLNLEKLSTTNDNQTQAIYELKKHIETIYELIAGDDAINRFKPDEMIDYIKVLNEQIAQWEDEEHESFIPTDE